MLVYCIQDVQVHINSLPILLFLLRKHYRRVVFRVQLSHLQWSHMILGWQISRNELSINGALVSTMLIVLHRCQVSDHTMSIFVAFLISLTLVQLIVFFKLVLVKQRVVFGMAFHSLTFRNMYVVLGRSLHLHHAWVNCHWYWFEGALYLMLIWVCLLCGVVVFSLGWVTLCEDFKEIVVNAHVWWLE